MMHYFGPFFGPYGYSGWGLAGMIIGMVIFLVLLALLIWFVVWAVRRASRGGYGYYGPRGQGSPSAIEIAQARYAKGEIGREDYLKLMEDLGGKAGEK